MSDEFDIDIDTISEETENFETDLAVSEQIELTVETLENWPVFDLEEFRKLYPSCRHLSHDKIHLEAQLIEDKLICQFENSETKIFSFRDTRFLNKGRYHLLFCELIPDIHKANDFDVEQENIGELQNKIKLNANKFLRQISGCKISGSSRARLI